jgi:hypothetical protein
MKLAAWSDRRVRTSGNVSAEDVRAQDQNESTEDDTDDLQDAGKKLLSAQNRPPSGESFIPRPSQTPGPRREDDLVLAQLTPGYAGQAGDGLASGNRSAAKSYAGRDTAILIVPKRQPITFVQITVSLTPTPESRCQFNEQARYGVEVTQPSVSPMLANAKVSGVGCHERQHPDTSPLIEKRASRRQHHGAVAEL